jgi:hypothetical protein
VKNYAFIDAQNVHKGIDALSWLLDWKRLRIYLTDKYKIQTAYLFLGYLSTNRDLYVSLQRAGYVLIFKPLIFDVNERQKGTAMQIWCFIQFLRRIAMKRQ